MVTTSTKALMKIASLLTTAEAAAIADVEGSTVFAWIKFGYLPAVRLGPLWVIDREEFEEYLRSRSQ